MALTYPESHSVFGLLGIFAKGSRATRNPQKYAETPYQIPQAKTLAPTERVTGRATLQIEPTVDDNLWGVDGFLDNLQRKLPVHLH